MTLIAKSILSSSGPPALRPVPLAPSLENLNRLRLERDIIKSCEVPSAYQSSKNAVALLFSTPLQGMCILLMEHIRDAFSSGTCTGARRSPSLNKYTSIENRIRVTTV